MKPQRKERGVARWANVEVGAAQMGAGWDALLELPPLT